MRAGEGETEREGEAPPANSAHGFVGEVDTERGGSGRGKRRCRTEKGEQRRVECELIKNYRNGKFLNIPSTHLTLKS